MSKNVEPDGLMRLFFTNRALIPSFKREAAEKQSEAAEQRRFQLKRKQQPGYSFLNCLLYLYIAEK